MTRKKDNETKANAEAGVDQLADDHRDRVDLNDPYKSGQEAVERALGYRKEEPKVEEPKAE
ncbi:hypothetical protein G6M04_16485 [Agrobacterium rhizogenes]|uniref:hypothetical protein n=1 Tax=Rhizobium rhizogenes TaxID=359 RepID=UPI001571AA23|nr:hypothetical protein [Rhizobium rhizogenes]NTG48976.1 hypothetical protein [Rhizobium rhizogenes]